MSTARATCTDCLDNVVHGNPVADTAAADRISVLRLLADVVPPCTEHAHAAPMGPRETYEHAVVLGRLSATYATEEETTVARARALTALAAVLAADGVAATHAWQASRMAAVEEMVAVAGAR